MKKSFLPIMKQLTRIKISWLTFNVALFMMAASAYALDIDNSATAVAVNVPNTVQMGTDLYACYMSHASAVVDDSQIDVAQADDWFQYKISSVTGGTFNAVLSMATQRETGKVNVSLYSTEGVLLQSGVSYGTYNGSWTNTIDYKYPLTLEAGIEYLMKVSLVDAGTNIKGMLVEASTQSPDATLSTLTFGGTEIADFNPAVYSYDYTATETVAQVELGATANVASASISGVGTVDIVEGDNALAIEVTAEDGSKLTYTVNVFNPYSSSTDATLSTLTIDEVVVDGFDPATYSYTVLLPLGVDKVTIGAESNDVLAQGIEGIGDTTLAEGRTAVAVTVTAESGLTQDYTLNLIRPIQVDGMKELMMLDDIINVPADKLPRVNNTQINWWNAGEYIEYYVYSATDEMISFAVKAANADAGNSSLNVSTYSPDLAENWILDEANTQIIPGGAADWSVENASNVYFNLELEANKPVVVRLQCVTNANGNSLANVYGFKLTAVDSVQTEKIRMVPTVEGDATTLFSIKDHNTGTNGTITVKESDNSFDSVRNGAWAKFQIKSSTSGEFDVVLNLGSNQGPARVNISLYNTLTGEWVADSDTVGVNTGNFSTKEDRSFRLPLEADVLYTMQINFISDGGWVCNVYNVSVEEYLGGTDATLSELMVDGVSILNSGVMAYKVDLPKGATDVPAITATANVAGATVAIMEATSLSDTTKVTVTSEDGSVMNTYMIVFEVAGPYMGTAMSVPGRIEFEYYDLGGEGVAFHDDGSKQGSDHAFRPTDMVDFDRNGNRVNVGYIAAGEWLSYTVDVADSADYLLRTHIASNNSGDLIVYIDGDSIASYTPKATGGWQVYDITDMDTLAIDTGEHVIKIEFSGNVRINVDYFELINIDSISSDVSLASVALNDSVDLTLVDGKKSYEVYVDSLNAIPNMIYAMPTHWGAMVSVAQASTTQGSMATIYVMAQDMETADTIEITFMAVGPYMGVPATIPGRIEFEHYDVGVEGVAFHDDDRKQGSDLTFRPNDMVDFDRNDDRINVGYTAAGEWLTYTINVAETGDYQLRTRVSNKNGTGTLEYWIDGDSIGSYMPTNTAGWQNYTSDIMDTISMEAGVHSIKIVYAEGVKFNLDYFELLDVNSISVDASLASIALNDSVALEGFDPAIMSYTVMIDSVKQIGNMLSAVATDANAMVSITQASQENQSKAIITVTAQDLQTVKTYEVMFELKGTAVKEVSAKADVKLYPNPAQDVLNISAKNEIVSIQVYSISGALVKEYASLGLRDVKVNLDLSKGVYFVSVATTEGTSTQKLIKR